PSSQDHQRCLINLSPYLDRRLFQPLGDEAGIGVDMYRLVTLRPRRELVRGVGGDHDDLPGLSPQLLASDSKRCPTASDDEGFGVRMLMQPWPDAGLGRCLQDDRDVGAAR